MAIPRHGMRPAGRLLLALLAMAGLAACGGGSDDGGNELAFRLIHASPDAPPLVVRLDDTNFTVMDYKDGTGFVFATPRTYDFEVQAIVPEAEPEPVFEKAILFEAGHEYTMIAIGKAGGPAGLAGLQPLVIENPLEAVTDGSFRLQVVHAAPDMPPLDFHLTAVPPDSGALPGLDGEQPLLELAYGVQPEDRQLATPGSYVMRVTPAGDPGAILLTSPELPFRNRDDFLVVVVANSRTGDSPISLAIDNRSQTFELSDRETTAELRVVHLGPDAPALDVVGVPGATSFPEVLFTDSANPTAIALDAANGRALVTDERGQAVIAVDLATGTRSVLSDNVTDAANPFGAPVSLALDGANGRVLVGDIHKGAIFAVDLGSGVRTVLSSSVTPDAANPLLAPTGIAIDSANGRALVVDNATDAIIAVDLQTGARTVLSNSSTPDAGNPFLTPTGIALDTARGRALVVDNRRGTVFAVDLSTGARTVLSNATTPDTANLFGTPVAITVDAANNRALVLDNRLQSLFAVDLLTGARTVLSSGTVPDATNPFAGPAGIALDGDNGRALVVDSRLSAVVAVALPGGARTILSAGPAPAGLGYLDATGYTGVVPDDYVLRGEAADAPDPVDPLFSTGTNLAFGQRTTLFAIGLVDETLNGVTAVDNTRPVVTEGKLRFVHAAPAAGAVDVYVLKDAETVATEDPVLINQTLGRTTPHASFTPGNHTVTFMKAGSKTDVIATQPVTAPASSAQSVILVDEVRVDEASDGKPASVLVLDDLAMP